MAGMRPGDQLRLSLLLVAAVWCWRGVHVPGNTPTPAAAALGTAKHANVAPALGPGDYFARASNKVDSNVVATAKISEHARSNTNAPHVPNHPPGKTATRVAKDLHVHGSNSQRSVALAELQRPVVVVGGGGVGAGADAGAASARGVEAQAGLHPSGCHGKVDLLVGIVETWTDIRTDTSARGCVPDHIKTCQGRLHGVVHTPDYNVQVHVCMHAGTCTTPVGMLRPTRS